MANWTPDGAVGEMFVTIAKHAPPPPGVEPPVLWGTEERLRELFGDGISDLRVERRISRQAFRSADHYIDFFRTYFGPTKMAFERVGPEGEQALERRPARPTSKQIEHGRRAGAGARGRVPAGDRDARLRRGGAQALGLGREDADRGADEEHREEDEAGDRAALPEGVGRRSSRRAPGRG